MTISKAISLVITEYLSKNKVSKQKLAEKSKISRAHLYKIINCNASPTAETLLLLSEAMNITVSKFMEKVQAKMKTD